MVQRTVPGKLGIEADQIKSDSGSEKSKPTIRTSSHQYPDGKACRGSDLKKKMKKSASIKRSNICSLTSFPFGAEIPQPGKPPPLGVRAPSSAAATPLKQPQVRLGDGLPNYMKPTSSSDARKERSSVSPPSTRTSSSDTNRTRRMSSAISKTGSPSGNNSKTPVKNLKRSLSLRLVRTLTKTPSFKPARSSSAKRSSKVVLCRDMTAQGVTCSSTQKDSKFPKYLTLNPGATEAEGTSAMRICPYTYCSLNGHHHTPLPPLNCLVSSRRRAMKAQRSLGSGAEERTLFGMSKSMEADGGRDFLIEIYAETKDKDTYSQESFPEGEEESEVQEEVDLPILVSEEALPVESFQGKYDSEVECHENIGEGESESLNMEWDGDCYLTSELDGAEEHLTGKQDVPETEKPEVCSHILLIHWKNASDEKVQQGEDEASPEAELPGDQVQEISDSCQVSDCLSYNQYSSSEEDELEEEILDAEESAKQAESIGIDPVLHKPLHNRGSASTCFSLEQELENFSYQSRCLRQVQEDTAVDEVREDIADLGPQRETQDLLSDEQQHQIKNVNKIQNFQILDEANEEKIKMIAASEDSGVEVDQKEVEINAQPSATEALLESHDPTIEKLKSKYTPAERNSQRDSDPSNISIGKNRRKSMSEEDEDPRRFNPQDPNYLPIAPKPEAEKVDLRHQQMDDRRNSDEWMIDYALRQAVTRLAPARKRKVALLVAAFEKVMPIPKVTAISKWETQHTSPRPIQACS